MNKLYTIKGRIWECGRIVTVLIVFVALEVLGGSSAYADTKVRVSSYKLAQAGSTAEEQWVDEKKKLIQLNDFLLGPIVSQVPGSKLTQGEINKVEDL